MYVKGKKKDRNALQAKCKEDNTPEILFAGFSQEFADALTYVRSLGFEEKPDYNKLRGFFDKIMQRHGWTMDYEYDWIIKKRQIEEKKALEEEQNRALMAGANPALLSKTMNNKFKKTNTNMTSLNR